VAVLLSAFLLLPGCDTDSYSEDMTYPVRSDPIVDPDGKPKADAFFPPPGLFAYLMPAYTQPPLNGKLLEPEKLPAAQRSQIQKSLDAIFGTPAKPKVDLAKVMASAEDAQAALKTLQLDDTAALAQGSILYRRHCLHCHGLTGDGHGPTAAWVNPHPRDFRPGIFKFISSEEEELGNARKPRRDDLLRTLRQGVEGTAMPSFGLLPDKDLNALASYVMHLSLRGQAEYRRMTDLFKDPEAARESTLENDLARLVGYWVASEQQPMKVQAYPFPETMDEDARKKVVERGFHLFGKTCLECHINFGRPENLKWDDWGGAARPADVTRGIYRGGRRPLDLYYRIRGGVPGTGMPAYRATEEETWALINFVQALPYPGMLPEGIRDKIYGPTK
jgi:mono/diheme cytochrome c family protein